MKGGIYRFYDTAIFISIRSVFYIDVCVYARVCVCVRGVGELMSVCLHFDDRD